MPARQPPVLTRTPHRGGAVPVTMRNFQQLGVGQAEGQGVRANASGAHSASGRSSRNFTTTVPLEHDSTELNHVRRSVSCLSMIFFGKPVPTFPDHALAATCSKR